MKKDEEYLKKLKETIDPYYMFSDDHQFWKKQNELHKEYWLLKAKLEGKSIKEAMASNGVSALPVKYEVLKRRYNE